MHFLHRVNVALGCCIKLFHWFIVAKYLTPKTINCGSVRAYI